MNDDKPVRQGKPADKPTATDHKADAAGHRDDAAEHKAEAKEHDPDKDRISKHGEPDQEELDAQQANVIGRTTGRHEGPTQDDLNPAYAMDKTDDEDAEDAKK